MDLQPSSGEQFREAIKGFQAGFKQLGAAIKTGLTQDAPRALESKCHSAMKAAMNSQAGLYAREAKGMVAPHATSILGKLGEVAREVGQYCLDKIGLKDAAERKLDHCQKRSEKLVEGLDAKLAAKEQELAAKETEAKEIEALFHEFMENSPKEGFDIARAKDKIGDQEIADRRAKADAYALYAPKDTELQELQKKSPPPSQEEISNAKAVRDRAAENFQLATKKWSETAQKLDKYGNPEFWQGKKARFNQLTDDIPKIKLEIESLNKNKNDVLQAGARAQGAIWSLKEARRELSEANRELRRAVRDRDLAKNNLEFAQDKDTARAKLADAEAKIDLTIKDSTPSKVKGKAQTERQAKTHYDSLLAAYEKTINEASSQTGVNSEASLAWPEQARVVVADLATRPGDLVEEQKDRYTLSQFNQYCDREIAANKAEQEPDQVIGELQGKVADAYESVVKTIQGDEVLPAIEQAHIKFKYNATLENYQALNALIKKRLGVDFSIIAKGLANAETRLDIAWRQKLGTNKSTPQLVQAKTIAQAAFEKVLSTRDYLRANEKRLKMTYEEAAIKGSIPNDLQSAKEVFDQARNAFEKAVLR